MEFPDSRTDLLAEQRRIAAQSPPAWRMTAAPAVAACFAAFSPPPATGAEPPDYRQPEHACAAVATCVAERTVDRAIVEGAAEAPYEPGLLALRSGKLLADAVRSLRLRPDVLIVNATGRDHPRRAGLALHLGAVLDLPTVGVTHRPLVAPVTPPQLVARGDQTPLEVGGERVGAWLCTANGRRPLVVHSGWRTDAETAVALVLAATPRYRTPLPLRIARSLARRNRSAARKQE